MEFNYFMPFGLTFVIQNSSKIKTFFYLLGYQVEINENSRNRGLFFLTLIGLNSVASDNASDLCNFYFFACYNTRENTDK
jgi:hypothetical protein